MSIHALFHLTHQQVTLLKIVMESGSLARAAAVLGIQPSTISKSMRRMEEHFGISLLKRHAKGVSPTPAGTMLLEKAVWFSNQSKVAYELIQELNDKESDTVQEPRTGTNLTVSIGTEMNDLLTSVAFQRLNNAQIGTVSLDVCAGAHIEQSVIDGSVDIGLLFDAAARADIQSTTIADEAMVLAYGPRLTNVSDAIMPRLHALGGIRMLMPTWEHSARRFVEQAALRAGVKLQVHAELGDLSALKTLLRQGLGYSILPHCTVREEESRGQLCAIPLQGCGSRIGIAMICRQSPTQRPNVLGGMRELVACVEQIVTAGRDSSIRMAVNAKTV